MNFKARPGHPNLVVAWGYILAYFSLWSGDCVLFAAKWIVSAFILLGMLVGMALVVLYTAFFVKEENGKP